jgi:hypothetical protein
MTYHANGKQVLRDGAHFADCIDSGAAILIADALNDRRTMSQPQRVLPLDGAQDGPLFVEIDKDDRVWVNSGEQRKLFPTPPTRDTAAFDAAPLNGPSIKKLQTAASGVNERLMKAAARVAQCRYQSIRQEHDEYACSCGKRWDVADGANHP